MILSEFEPWPLHINVLSLPSNLSSHDNDIYVLYNEKKMYESLKFNDIVEYVIGW
jgi:hypothetical protein